MSALAVPSLLSQALVAFTIEFDNESEHRITHRTTVGRGADQPRGPWLVSQVMWANVMRYVVAAGSGGIAVPQLHAQARTTKDSLGGLQRWGYVKVADSVVTATGWGRRAQRVWEPLAAEIEERWAVRFGADHARLRAALEQLASAVDLDLPDYLPITFPTQNGKLERFGGLAKAIDPSGLDLSVLLSRALLTYTVDFERESAISLPISADTLRLLAADPLPLRELPRLSGVSREAQNMATGFLARIGCAVAEPIAGGRGQSVRLTAKGLRGKAKYQRLLAATEQTMTQRFGADVITALRASLEAIVDGPILQGLQGFPEGWRAGVRPLTRCRTIRWSCIAGDFRTEADGAVGCADDRR
jgi:hypothetical protein